MDALTSRELIDKLIGFDTTSRDSNLALIDFVRDYLDGFGIASTLIFDETRRKANLWATIGPDDIGGVVLSGHTDVVPVDGQPWDSDPFNVIERDGRLFGRGTSDMKSFIAIALARVPQFRAASLRLPVHLAFSYDEEVGCLGVHGIIDHLKVGQLAGRPLPRLAIVGEPTGMQVVDAHKGVFSVNTEVIGLEAHSSAPQTGVNAIQVAAGLIGRLDDLQRELAAPGLTDNRFEPPWSTIQVGTIGGGTARNIIPLRCEFGWAIRPLPGVDVRPHFERWVEAIEREVVPAMQAVHPSCCVRHRLGRPVQALSPEPGSPAEALAFRLAGANRTIAVSYAAEAGSFQAAGIPTVLCGPGHISEAHKPNEFIDLSQVAACEAFMDRLVGELTA
jgi:acetylornithine deacetylase